MNARVIFTLAWRESRTARRRLQLYMSSIFLGVAALVAIDSFAENVTSSVREQSRALLGGDLSVTSRAPLPASVTTLLDSLEQSAGVRTADITTFASMAVVPRTTLTRLAQVRAISPGYPYYGEITTQPAGATVTRARGYSSAWSASLGWTVFLASTLAWIGFGAPYRTDLHELQLTDQGTAYIGAYRRLSDQRQSAQSR